MLKIDLRAGESVRIGDVTVTLLQKSGQHARLSVEADRTIPIVRSRPASHPATIPEDTPEAATG